MRKKLLVTIAVLILMVLAATFLGSYSTAYSKWYDQDQIAGQIVGIDYEAMKLTVEIPMFPYGWLETVKLSEHTNITIISCDGEKQLRPKLDLEELERGMKVRVWIKPDYLAYLIKVYDSHYYPNRCNK